MCTGDAGENVDVLGGFIPLFSGECAWVWMWCGLGIDVDDGCGRYEWRYGVGYMVNVGHCVGERDELERVLERWRNRLGWINSHRSTGGSLVGEDDLPHRIGLPLQREAERRQGTRAGGVCFWPRCVGKVNATF